MARHLRISSSGAFYHITSRGNEQRAVFKSNRDRDKFLESAVKRYDAVIHAYCLMDNHYHLLLETPSGNLSKILTHINGVYTTYFNVKRKRFGHLFQGRYKAIKDNNKLSWNIKIYLCQRLTGNRLDDIGVHFGIGGSGVCQVGRRIAAQIENDKDLTKTVKQIEDNLSRQKV